MCRIIKNDRMAVVFINGRLYEFDKKGEALCRNLSDIEIFKKLPRYEVFDAPRNAKHKGAI